MLPTIFNNGFFPTIFDELINDTGNLLRTPATNVREYQDKYVIDIAAPGITREHCSVSINQDGNLSVTINSRSESNKDDAQHRYIRREFSHYSYSKDYTLPDDTDRDGITAKTENGVLTITLPKIKERKKLGKTIEIA